MENRKLISIIVAIVILVGATVGGFIWTNGKSDKSDAAATTPASENSTVTAAPSPEASTEPVSSLKDIAWGQQIGTPTEDLAPSVAIDSKSNCYIAGYTNGDLGGKSAGYSDIFVAKYDTEGKQLWTLQEGTASDDLAKYIAINASDEVFITGMTKEKLKDAKGSGSGFVQKLGEDGKILWTRQYGGENTLTSNAIVIDGTGNLYIGGSVYGQLGKKAFGQTDGYISKLDKNGKVIWTCQWGSDSFDEVTHIAIDADGNLYAIGQTSGQVGETAIGDADLFLSKISPEGEHLYSKQYGTTSADTAYKILVDSAKNIYLTGSTEGDFEGTQIGGGDSIFLKVDNAGNILWKKQFGTKLWDGIHGIALSKENPMNVIVGGCQNWDDCQAFLRKFDPDGNELWKKELITDFSSCGREFALDAQGYIYQSGGVHGKLFNDKTFEGPDSDIFLYKISEK